MPDSALRPRETLFLPLLHLQLCQYLLFCQKGPVPSSRVAHRRAAGALTRVPTFSMCMRARAGQFMSRLHAGTSYCALKSKRL